jgi:hypothetical protein
MIDVKKLITGFLILATAVICSGLVLSYVESLSHAAVATPANHIQIIADGGASPATMTGNAFLNGGTQASAAQEMIDQLTTSSTLVQINDSKNLTGAVADSFLNELVSANPNGVQTDSSGNLQFNAPDTQAIAGDISSNQGLLNIKTPDWEVEAAKQAVKVQKNYTDQDELAYLSSINNIFQKYIGSTDVGNILGRENPSDAAVVKIQIQQELQEVTAIPTPTPLVPFQKSFLKLLVYEKNMSELVADANDDPLKSSLLFQAEQGNYDLAITQFQTAWQNAAGGRPFPTSTVPTTSLRTPSGNEFVAFVNQFLGIPTAHAQFAVYDAAVFSVSAGTFSASSAQLGKTIEKYIEDILVQILKNVLTTLIQRKVLTWIQGSGAPRFVTDFGTQLVNSYQASAINFLNSKMKCVNQYMTPNIRALVTTPSITVQASTCGAEFSNIVNGSGNIANLYNRFSNMNDYLGLFQPGGNTWGVLMTLQDESMNAGVNSAAAQNTKTVSQQGWKGSETCGDNSNPNGTHIECISQDGKNYNLAPTGESCDASDQAITVPNAGKCTDGSDPQVTSPGQVTGQGFFSGLKSGVENITSAQNLTGILNALLSTVLNTLAQNAINYSNQELNNLTNGNTSTAPPDTGTTGIPPSSITTSSSTVPQTALQCIPQIQSTILSTSTYTANASLSAIGGKVDSSCAADNSCPSTENPDGTPIYSWSAPRSTVASGYGSGSFSTTYTAIGTYFVTVTASTDNSTAQCEVDVIAAP